MSHYRLDAGVDRLGQDGVSLGAVLADVGRGLVMGHGGPTRPRQLECAELVGGHAESEHVEPLIRRLTVNQFRGHVVERASAIAGLHEPLGSWQSETEVNQFQVFTLVCQKEMSRADVAMNEPSLVDCRNRLCSLADETDAASGQTEGAGRQRRIHVRSREMLHHQILRPFSRQTVFKGLHDIGMFQLDGDFAFRGFVKSLEAGSRRGQISLDLDFQSNHPTRLQIAGRIELRHRAQEGLAEKRESL